MRLVVLSSTSDAAEAEPEASPKKKWGALQGFVDGLNQSLLNFGVGRNATKEGGVGIFMLCGIATTVILFGWVKQIADTRGLKPYTAILRFPQAYGIQLGTPFRIRGVNAGEVKKIVPGLDSVQVEVEVMDQNVLIPRNSLIEANQHGLIAETQIDVMPESPFPNPKAGPLDPECEEEGLLVCHRGVVDANTGVSLDELVRVCTKLAWQMDRQGIERMFDTADIVSKAVEEATPLLNQLSRTINEISPLLNDMNEGDLVRSLEALTRAATNTANDINRLNNDVLTPENTALIRDSVRTLYKTLTHIESVSKDVSMLTGDIDTQHNLRMLIQSLSRMLSD